MLQSLDKFYLPIRCKEFQPGKREPPFVLPGSCFTRMKLAHVMASACLSGMKKLIKISVWKNPKRYIPLDRSYFYCIFTTRMTSICEKKGNKCLYMTFFKTNIRWKPVLRCRDENWFFNAINFPIDFSCDLDWSDVF